MTSHPNRNKTCRPRNHLAAAGKLYPNAWRLVDELRADRGKPPLPNWPDWCFLPLAGIYWIICQDAGTDRVPPEQALDIARLGALAAWRVGQGIYRFDQDLYQELIKTPVIGNIPCAALLHLPEWCVYVETPEFDWGGTELYGFWAHLEWDATDGRAELRLLLDTEISLTPFPLHLVEGDLDAAIDAALRVARQQSVMHAYPALPPPPEGFRESFEPLLSLLLYLCAENAEIGDGSRTPARPKPKNTKKGWRLFPADKPATWEVGLRLGSALRRSQGAEPTQGDGTHARPRPHVRRAHWHSFWTGPRDGERVARVKWLPPIPVNVEELGELPATVRPID